MECRTSSVSIGHADILVGPHQIAFDITNKCNLRCLHCYNASGENHVSCNELTDEEILKFINDISKIKVYNLCFCGGETLIKKDMIIEATKKLKNQGIPNIAMVTNGILMTKEVARELKDAGVTKIQISLDGSNAKSHDRLRNQQGAFEKAIQAIEILCEIGIHPNIAFTPTSFNINELREVYDLLKRYELNDIEIRTQPLMLLGRASNNLLEIKPTSIQYRNFVKEINKLNKLNDGPIIKWGDPVDHLVRYPYKINCSNFCTIRANGDIVVSPYLPLVVGNIKRHSFIEYWDKGLAKIWSYKIPQYFANKIKSIEDMNKTYDNLPKVWQDTDIYIDLIDEDLNDLNILLKN